MADNKGIAVAPGVIAEQKGNILTLTLELDAQGKISKSGKSKVHSSTNGFRALPNGMRISLNVIS